MAEDKSNESPEDRTRKTMRFPEAQGKTVESIEINVTPDHHSVNVNFTDHTAIVVSLEPSVTMLPIYADWATGERKILKEWEPIESVSLRT